jgi:hypothetical protein
MTVLAFYTPIRNVGGRMKWLLVLQGLVEGRSNFQEGALL